ncbi:hypothetical protein PL75_06900 [Neisseria arctica]|uniref:Uracil-DNA glycosylase-like domain-containing protein n=1 Tax=Neisseria arctica TaxID=1470200 RepID=A0A0J0YR67_9NEIS|nr:uracil-DNA glycosylase family protein [Neisseria arctica]KLT72612.1 hypothetical protein PL75_06900 [Neisseria arctica]UOO86308.1 uracil-DNA glycosylase [Neisseria arctica]
MLSSRYIHLHEALGLGPIWLLRGAKVLSSDHERNTHEAEKNFTTAKQIPTPHDSHIASQPQPENHARLAAMAAIGSLPASTGMTIRKNQVDISASYSDAHSSKNTQSQSIIEATVAPTANIKPVPLMIVSICPAPEDNLAGELFSGDVGILLSNMLKSINLSNDTVYKTTWVNNTAIFSPNPTTEQIYAALPRIQAELKQAEASAILLMGQIFEQPEQSDVLNTLCGNTPHFIIPHPARLLRQPQLKAETWKTLKKIQSLLK